MKVVRAQSLLACTLEQSLTEQACYRWNRQWTAEENRHGDLMNKYCYLSGRVNMKAVERTIQNLIGSGMDPKTENNPYLGFIYTSFQERATKVSSPSDCCRLIAAIWYALLSTAAASCSCAAMKRTSPRMRACYLPADTAARLH